MCVHALCAWDVWLVHDWLLRCCLFRSYLNVWREAYGHSRQFCCCAVNLPIKFSAFWSKYENCTLLSCDHHKFSLPHEPHTHNAGQDTSPASILLCGYWWLDHTFYGFFSLTHSFSSKRFFVCLRFFSRGYACSIP